MMENTVYLISRTTSSNDRRFAFKRHVGGVYTLGIESPFSEDGMNDVAWYVVHNSVEGRVVYLWEEKGVQLVRVASGDLVYNVPARMLVDETKSK
jgi:hypothetical protein